MWATGPPPATVALMESSRSQAERAGPSRALGSALLVAGCGDPARRDGPRGGDTWFDQLDRVQVLQYPEGNLPEDVARLVEQAGSAEALTVPSESWSRLREVPAAYREGFALAPETAIWEASEVSAIQTVPSPPRIVHAGRAMASLAGASPTDPDQTVPLWWDQQAGLVVWWEPRQSRLRALSERPPAELLVEPVDPGSGKALRYEQPARIAAGGPGVGALDQSVALEDVTRRALLLPAPGRLALPVARLEAAELWLAVGLVDHALQRQDGQLVSASGLSDGATCAVEVELDGRRERVWSTHVRPGEAWQRARVDLSAWSGRELTLHLVSEAGPVDDAAFDYVVWGELRLGGRSSGVDGRPSVVLIVVDTLRADRLGCYGYERPTSPRLDAWAERGAVVYEDAVTDASWTLPSTVSILTGRPVHHHRVGDGRLAIGRDAALLAERLSAAGYATFGICEGGYVRPQFGFARGFDTFIVQPDQEPDWSPALQHLDDLGGVRPSFLFLQTYIVHHPFPADDGRLPLEEPYEGWLAGEDVTWWNVIGPYLAGDLDLTEEDRRYVRHLYDVDVRRMDDVVGDVLEELERRFAGGELLVVVTSDHGDEHFEHGGMDHGHSLHAELLDVPLIVRFPDRRAARVSEPTSTLDIVPTILQAASLDVPEELPGRVLGGRLPARHVRVGGNQGGMLSVQYDGRKLLQVAGDDGLSIQLYDLRADPTEQQSLVDAHPQAVKQLQQRLAEFLEEHGRELSAVGEQDEVELDQAAIDQLRELGYLGDH
jgi:arylsulfatase A-like enzyme